MSLLITFKVYTETIEMQSYLTHEERHANKNFVSENSCQCHMQKLKGRGGYLKFKPEQKVRNQMVSS